MINNKPSNIDNNYDEAHHSPKVNNHCRTHIIFVIYVRPNLMFGVIMGLVSNFNRKKGRMDLGNHIGLIYI